MIFRTELMEFLFHLLVFHCCCHCCNSSIDGSWSAAIFCKGDFSQGEDIHLKCYPCLCRSVLLLLIPSLVLLVVVSLNLWLQSEKKSIRLISNIKFMGILCCAIGSGKQRIIHSKYIKCVSFNIESGVVGLQLTIKALSMRPYS